MIKKSFIISFPISLAIVSSLLTFVPDSIFQYINPFKFENIDVNLLLIRILILIVVFTLCFGIVLLYRLKRKQIILSGKNYTIEVAYKNLFDLNDCLKVINFDECFTTRIGEKPEDIKKGSVCGQYLTKHPLTDDDIINLINESGVRKAERKSKYKGQTCYDPGTIIQKDDYLLMAFAKLNKDGRGVLTRDEYIDCLNLLWKEIDKYHGEKSVAIPVLGSNITHFEDSTLTQQELLDIMISSYKMNNRKIKKPLKLIICCQKKDDFSLNKIGDFI